MTRYEIDAFLTVAEAGSLRAAADRLYLSQPALSRRLDALEQELNCRLMLREKGRRNITLTPEGHDFIDMARRMKAVYDDADSLSSSVGTGRLSGCAIPSVSIALLSEAFRDYLDENPETRLRFRSYHSSECFHSMENGESDFAFVSSLFYSRSVTAAPFLREEMVLVAAPGLFESDSVSLAQPDPRREVFVPWSEDFRQWHHIKMGTSAAMTLDEIAMLEDFLTDDMWLIAPASIGRRLVRTGKKIHHLADGPAPRIIYTLQSEREPSEVTKHFLSFAADHLSQVDGVTVYADRLKAQKPNTPKGA